MSHHIDQSRLYTGYDLDQLPFREKYSIMDRTTKNNMDYLRRIDEASVDNWGERVFKYHDESPLNAFLFPNLIVAI